VSESSDFDARRFRTVLGHYPTGVTIVTGLSDGAPMGLTIGSFTSVSLDPPLVGFLPQTTSTTWAAMAEHGAFCVNVLSGEQGDLCWKFAKSDLDTGRFDGVAWHPGPTGSPIIDESLSWIDCTVESVVTMGDHYFVLGRVVALDAATDAPAPLLFNRGSLGTFHPLG
jgi:flavin reductase (DIM6/NTAB) family NADH-FMN oxidoreductase RutF